MVNYAWDRRILKVPTYVHQFDVSVTLIQLQSTVNYIEAYKSKANPQLLAFLAIMSTTTPTLVQKLVKEREEIDTNDAD